MKKNIIVIGGGISGLTVAHKLSKDGHNVTLIEATSQLGGLGTYFNYEGKWIDKFYHCIMPSDEPLLNLIEQVGLKNQMYWRPTRMGFAVDGKRYAFNGPVDLLKFKPLKFTDRIRFGIASLLLRQLGKGLDLDNTRIEDWFIKLYGRDVWKKILEPLFRSKFGSHAGSLPALYIWERLGREKNKSTRGYINGGLKALIDAIEQNIENYGGKILLNTAVEKIDSTNGKMKISLANGEMLESDWVIATIPVPLIKKAVSGTSLENLSNLPELTYQGVVNALFFLKKPLDNFYWQPVVNSNTEFDGVVEMTELVKTEQYNGNYMVYTMKYCSKDSGLFKEDENAIAQRWKEQLKTLFTDLNLKDDDFTEIKIFKAPFVEPVYPLGYSKLKPRMRTGNSNLLLATSAQVYPSITSWNSSVGLANKVVDYLYDLENGKT